MNVDYGIITIFFQEMNNPVKGRTKRQPMKKRPNVFSNARFNFFEVKDRCKNDDV